MRVQPDAPDRLLISHSAIRTLDELVSPACTTHRSSLTRSRRRRNRLGPWLTGLVECCATQQRFTVILIPRHATRYDVSQHHSASSSSCSAPTVSAPTLFCLGTAAVTPRAGAVDVIPSSRGNPASSRSDKASCQRGDGWQMIPERW